MASSNRNRTVGNASAEPLRRVAIAYFLFHKDPSRSCLDGMLLRSSLWSWQALPRPFVPIGQLWSMDVRTAHLINDIILHGNHARRVQTFSASIWWAAMVLHLSQPCHAVL